MSAELLLWFAQENANSLKQWEERFWEQVESIVEKRKYLVEGLILFHDEELAARARERAEDTSPFNAILHKSRSQRISAHKAALKRLGEWIEHVDSYVKGKQEMSSQEFENWNQWKRVQAGNYLTKLQIRDLTETALIGMWNPETIALAGVRSFEHYCFRN